MSMGFGEWLGKENGKEMMYEVFGDSGSSPEQARASLTTYCFIFNVEVDTKEWDELVRYFYDHYNSWFDTFEEFETFMCEDLV